MNARVCVSWWGGGKVGAECHGSIQPPTGSTTTQSRFNHYTYSNRHKPTHTQHILGRILTNLNLRNYFVFLILDSDPDRC